MIVTPGMSTFGATTAGGTRYGELIVALRGLTDAVAAADAPDSVLVDAVADARRLASLLDDHRCTGDFFPAGHRWDLPARGHPLLVPVEPERVTQTEMLAHVRFSSAHMGHKGVAHGGFIPLVFDEALGVFPVRLDPPARTVSLSVQYRAGAPIDEELTVSARLVRNEGRKVLVRGALHFGDRLLAEAEGLFVQPRP